MLSKAIAIVIVKLTHHNQFFRKVQLCFFRICANDIANVLGFVAFNTIIYCYKYLYEKYNIRI